MTANRPSGAPRRLSRQCRRLARGARLLACLWLAGPGFAQDPGIVAAAYAQPTARYPHAVLGDAEEWGALRLTFADGTQALHVLPQTLVFEDLAPRLQDLDFDGTPEVIVVESSQTEGGRLAVWGAEGRIAATPHIGTRFRWLGPVGAADLDGDGAIEIAYVDRPHLAKVLRVWRFDDGRLTPVAEAAGFSNHRIGWDYIAGGIRVCGEVPEMVLASGDWRRVLAVALEDGALRVRDLGRYSDQALTNALACRGG